jgi:hypothetical protein
MKSNKLSLTYVISFLSLFLNKILKLYLGEITRIFKAFAYSIWMANNRRTNLIPIILETKWSLSAFDD